VVNLRRFLSETAVEQAQAAVEQAQAAVEQAQAAVEHEIYLSHSPSEKLVLCLESGLRHQTLRPLQVLRSKGKGGQQPGGQQEEPQQQQHKQQQEQHRPHLRSSRLAPPHPRPLLRASIRQMQALLLLFL